MNASVKTPVFASPTNPRFANRVSTAGHHAGKYQDLGVAWSSSPNADNTDNAWNVNFNNGNDNNDNKNNANYVRLVRSGEWNPNCPAAPLSFEDLHTAWQSAKRRKRPSHNQLAFESDWLASLSQLQTSINTGAWWPSPPVCFVTTHPKAREIHAPDFSDRVLHHWLVPRLEPLFEPAFVFDSFSNRKGKGTHAAVQRLQLHMRQLEGGAGKGGRASYFLQLDIHNFFNSIHRPTLYALLKARVQRVQVRQPRLLPEPLAQTLCWFCHRLLAKSPAAHVQWRARSHERAQVPPHKRLAEAAEGCGLPIGNLTSQFFANVYMNELDQFIKRALKCKHYVRYVDDFVLLHESQEQLTQWQAQIADFLQAKLRLKLKADIKRGDVKTGVDFLGYGVHPHFLTIRPRVLEHAKARLAQLASNMNPEALRSIVASYWGHWSHARAHKARRSLCHAFPWLTLWFSTPDQPLPRWRTPPKAPRAFADQVAWFQAQFPSSTVTIQRGLARVVMRPVTQQVASGKQMIWVRETGQLETGLKARVVVGERRQSPHFSIFSRSVSL